jgi:hypothetical protein
LAKIPCKMMFSIMLEDLGLQDVRYNCYTHEDEEVSAIITFYVALLSDSSPSTSCAWFPLPRRSPFPRRAATKLSVGKPASTSSMSAHHFAPYIPIFRLNPLFWSNRLLQSTLKTKLAEMHKAAKSDKGYGFHVENTTGIFFWNLNTTGIKSLMFQIYD